MNHEQIVFSAIDKQGQTLRQIHAKNSLELWQTKGAISRLKQKALIGYDDDGLYITTTKKHRDRILNMLGIAKFYRKEPQLFTHREQPFSTNEMHYGRNAPSRYTWADVEGEAMAIGYKTHSLNNLLPIIELSPRPSERR